MTKGTTTNQPNKLINSDFTPDNKNAVYDPIDVQIDKYALILLIALLILGNIVHYFLFI